MAGRRYYPALDILRLAAALAVVSYHYCSEMSLIYPVLIGHPGIDWLAQAGRTAMDVFFLLSGAALALGYGPGVPHPDWCRYARSRILTIYPMYWLGFGVLFLYSDVLHGNNAGIPRWRVVFSLLGLDGYLLQFTPTFYKIGEWFLGCLLLLYLLFPLLAALLRALPRRPWLWVLPAAVCLAAWVWLPTAAAGYDATHTVLWRLPMFGFGILLGTRLEDTAFCARVGVGSALLLALAAGLRLPPYYTSMPLAVLLFVALHLGLRRPAAQAERWQRPLRWLSGQYYGVFLVHHVLLTLVFVPHLADLGPVGGYLAFLPACFALAWVLRQAARPLAALLGRLLPG